MALWKLHTEDKVDEQTMTRQYNLRAWEIGREIFENDDDKIIHLCELITPYIDEMIPVEEEHVMYLLDALKLGDVFSLVIDYCNDETDLLFIKSIVKFMGEDGFRDAFWNAKICITKHALNDINQMWPEFWSILEKPHDDIDHLASQIHNNTIATMIGMSIVMNYYMTDDHHTIHIASIAKMIQNMQKKHPEFELTPESLLYIFEVIRNGGQTRNSKLELVQIDQMLPPLTPPSASAIQHMYDGSDLHCLNHKDLMDEIIEYIKLL